MRTEIRLDPEELLSLFKREFTKYLFGEKLHSACLDFNEELRGWTKHGAESFIQQYNLQHLDDSYVLEVLDAIRDHWSSCLTEEKVDLYES